MGHLLFYHLRLPLRLYLLLIHGFFSIALKITAIGNNNTNTITAIPLFLSPFKPGGYYTALRFCA